MHDEDYYSPEVTGEKARQGFDSAPLHLEGACEGDGWSPLHFVGMWLVMGQPPSNPVREH